MKSIRQHLLRWLLAGVGLFFLLAGGSVYFTARFILLSEVETELQQARKVVFNLYQQDRLRAGAFSRRSNDESQRLRFRDEERWRQFDSETGDLLYQLKTESGSVLARSVSLGERSIEVPSSTPHSRESSTLFLSDGTPAIARIDFTDPNRRSSPGNERIEIVVARDISEIKRSLSLLLVGIAAVGLVGGLATAGLLTLILRRGLFPLDELGRKAAEIDAHSLSTRFEEDSMPRELQPISGRLNQLMERLQNSFERERRFSADLAHEIRTPIAEISAMAEAAMLHPDKCPPDQFEKILTSARDMHAIVENLLDLARWEQGAAEWSTEEVSLATTIEDCWQPFQLAAESRDLKVELQVSPDGTIQTNPVLFRQILTNLFSNAVEYSPEGGLVRIESRSLEESDAPLFSVSNTADQIDADQVPHLFERFWRADSARSGSGHSGLGLSVARACANSLSLELSASLDNKLLHFEVSEAVER